MSAWQELVRERGCLRVGHRGAAGLAPQNTLLAFQRAIELGVDAVELDVRRTADGHLVVIHCEELAETTDGTGLVSSHTLNELRGLDAGQGERIPVFGEALEYLRGRVLVVVDVKVPAIVEQVVRVIGDHGMRERVLLCALGAESLCRAHALAPDISTAFSYPDDVGGVSTKPYLAAVVSAGLATMRATLPWRVAGMIRGAQAGGAMLHQRVISPALVAEVHRHGWTIGAWTVDDPQEMMRLRAMGVDSITSNRPDLLVQ